MNKIHYTWLLTVVGVVGCGSDPSLNPSERKGLDQPTATPYNAKAFRKFGPEQQAYIAGHALGICYLKDSLQASLAGLGYTPPLGVSAHHARIPYSYSEMVATPCKAVMGTSSQSVRTSPVACEETQNCTHAEPFMDNDSHPDGDPGFGSHETDDATDKPAKGGDTPDDDVSGGDEDQDQDEDEDGDEDEDEDGDEDEDEDEDEEGDEDTKRRGSGRFIDEDCETFLDPAAMDARTATSEIDPEQALLLLMSEDEISEKHIKQFSLGLREALHLEDLDEDTDHSEVEHLKEHVQQAGLCEHSPLVLDLDGNGVQATTPGEGVFFDLRESGNVLQTSWPVPGDALLALDKNNDGWISDGSELFGNSKTRTGRYPHGFAALAIYDRPRHGGNRDGLIDRRDSVFLKLRLWQDLNRDGVSQAQELMSLKSAGILGLDLSFSMSTRRDAGGNLHAQKGEFIRANDDGSTGRGQMVDVWLRTQSATSRIRATRPWLTGIFGSPTQ